MIYRCKNTCRFDGVCSNYQRHKKSQEQRLKERFKSNFQTRNKLKLCDSKIRIQEQRIISQDVQNKRENKSLLC
jgi:hypothetical protein